MQRYVITTNCCRTLTRLVSARPTFAAAMLLACACTGDPVTRSSNGKNINTPTTPAGPATPSLLLELVPTPLVTSIYTAEGLVVFLFVRDANGGGTNYTDAATWTSSDTTVATLRTGSAPARRADIVGKRSGSTVLTATVRGLSASMTITVLPPPSGNGEVVVESFSVVQVGMRNYAPLMVVRETKNEPGAGVFSVQFTIPGLYTHPGTLQVFGCSGFIRVPPGGRVDLFPEIYGSFALEIGGNAPATGSETTAIVTVTGSGGAQRAITAIGKIVPGDYPTTYTGGVNLGWSCR